MATKHGSSQMSNKMTILMFSRLFYPHIGGVENHVEKLSRELIKKGHQITIITELFQKNLKKTETRNKVKIFRIPVPHQEKQKKWHIWKWFWQNRRLMQKADLIHIHDVFFWFLPLKPFFLKKPVYITCHGYEGIGPPTIKAILQRKIGEWLTHGTICIGQFMKKWYKAKPNFIIYGATDSIKSVTAKPNTAIYLGRLSGDTGIMVYLETLKLLKDKKINLTLNVYGNGPQLIQAQKFTKKHKLNVNFHSFVKDASSKIPQNSLAFISRYLGILEAMLSKRPVFAVYNNQIKKDYLTCHPQAKNMIITKDEKILADSIIKCLNNPKQFQGKIHQAYKWARKQTWGKITEKYLQLWKI